MTAANSWRKLVRETNVWLAAVVKHRLGLWLLVDEFMLVKFEDEVVVVIITQAPRSITAGRARLGVEESVREAGVRHLVRRLIVISSNPCHVKSRSEVVIDAEVNRLVGRFVGTLRTLRRGGRRRPARFSAHRPGYLRPGIDMTDA